MSIAALPYKYSNVPTGGGIAISYFNTSGTGIRYPAFSFVAESSFDLAHFYGLNNFGNFPSLTFYRHLATGALEGAAQAYHDPGVRYFVNAITSLSSFQQYRVVMGLPSGINTIDAPGSVSLNMSFYKPAYILLRLPNYPTTGVPNITVSATTNATNKIYFVPQATRWPNYFTRAYVQQIYGTGGKFQLDACSFDLTKREVYIKLVMEETSQSLTDEEILNGTGTVRLDLQFYIDAATPTFSIDPNAQITTYSNTKNMFAALF